MGVPTGKRLNQSQFRPGKFTMSIPYLSGGLALLVMPAFLPSYLQGMMTKFLILAVLAMSLDLLFGYGGLSSLGQAAYFGVGGYTVAVLMYHYGVKSFWIGAPLGILTAALTAAIFGIIALRVSGIYFLLITFALGQLLYSVAWNVKWLNGPGIQGLTGLSRPDLGLHFFTWSTISFYYFVVVIFTLCYFLLSLITKSPFGLALMGIREGESRMEALGYNTWLHKYLTFVIAGAISGVAGELFVYNNRFISPAQLGIGTSFLAMSMAIIGGRGTLFGPVIGAAIIVFVEYFASISNPERWPLILGGIFVLSIMFIRDGVGKYVMRFWKKVVEDYGSPEA